LLDKLGYSAPKQIARFLREHGAKDAKDILDLGCGTGLMGAELAAPGRRIDGVDLSERMLSQARAKGVYDELHAAELLGFLRDSPRQWDLIVAADVFIYVADLGPIFTAAFDRLRAGGHFAFSIECSDTSETQLLAQTGRYRHAPEPLAAALDAAGFRDVRRESVTLRLESGAPVAGELLLARRP
jgi:predicted TPR repeat methyltransferase